MTTKEYQKAYRQEHMKEHIAYCRKYYQEHKEEQRACKKKYHLKHGEERRAKGRKYYQEHREERIAYHEKYNQEHREEHKLKHKVRTWDIKLKVIKLLGGRCRNCNLADARVLQVNHLNGGGTKERAFRGSNKFYLGILSGERGVGDLELLCANCNILYEYEVGRRYDGEYKPKTTGEDL